MKDIYNRRNSIQWIQQEDIRYPDRLRPYKGMPRTLYVIGRLPDPERPAVAVVGSRRSTPYGNSIARQFSMELAAHGVQIISGLAWGIDAAAHVGALEGGGDTYAVMGCGVDVCYPAGNRGLYERILREEKGGILSEQEPGRPPLPGYFPARNRIISGLADLVLVVEAREKSGSLITADQALEQGKDVYAVPGRITDELSRGCINLLKQGAGVADSPKTLLEALHISGEKKQIKKDSGKILLAKDEDIVYSWIRLQPVSLEKLVEKTGFPAAKVLQITVLLEIRGLIREIRKNEYIRTDSRIIDGEIFSDRGVTGEGEDN